MEEEVGQGGQDEANLFFQCLHMNRQVFVFPDTVPTLEMLFPLVQVFAQVVYCLPVENGPGENGKVPADCQDLLAAGFCRLEEVLPLGKDRDRFLRLVRELRSRQDDYAAQLAHLTLAGMGGGSRERNESDRSIVRQLLDSQGIEPDGRQELQMILWQARLVLKLGELYDEEQQALHRELERIGRREEELFMALRREKSDVFSFTRKLLTADRQPDGQMALRLKAWSRLVFLGAATNQRKNEVYVTACQDALDRLKEEYIGRTGGPAGHLGSVILPAPGKDPASCSPDSVRLFHKEAGDLLASLDFQAPAGMPVASAQEGGQVIERPEEWHSLLDRIYPPADFGRCRLDLYAFPGLAASTLFLSGFGTETDLPAGDDSPAVEVAVQPVVVGLLTGESGIS